ncbi:putative GNAT family acetyltransferase [Annulohypoxylon maeteangense]|uniref:putative GNAT family acetyltransferase n=1 Tax=Annulohypoxylon maeteangense TaxID=1927788 RepID=UPI0020089EA9|nr:putative GNAT family acetyltransferase [Annulohypoxylon maeteangense]KAI0886934.1 putative GNAT family acetyltransferase [Annulohypoxylon maeteangense]
MSTTKPFNPFHSELLIYRAVEDTIEDKSFVNSIQSDAEAQSGSSYGLLRPESMKTSDEFKKHVAEKCLLGAIICLPYDSREPLTNVNAGSRVGIVCLKSNPQNYAHHRWSDISIDIAKEYRGKGYGGEAIRWALWYGFQMAGLHRIQISALSFNTGAEKLYRKLGFTEEGRQREFMWFNGSWHDHILFSMLEDEWREIQKKAGKEV